jgi:hypothetical protein
MKPAGKCAILLCLTILAITDAASGASGYFTYTDEKGRTYFVDSPDKIPPEYRENTTAHKNKIEEEIERLESVREDISPDTMEELRREYLKRLGEMRRERRMEESRLNKPLGKGTARETPVVTANNQVIVPVEISYKGKRLTANLLLDTGANQTILHAGLADRLGLRMEQLGAAEIAGGGIIPVAGTTVDQVRVGPKAMVNYQVLVVEYEGAQENLDGLLGMSFLRHFPHSVDYGNSMIRWSK